MTREDLSLRHRAALSHLAALPLLTSVWLPLLLRRTDLDSDFLYRHSTGAAYYQGLSLLSLIVLWLGRHLPYRFMDEASANFLLAFLGVVALCLAGMYLMGAVGLALLAWNGDAFWAPVVSWLLGYGTEDQ